MDMRNEYIETIKALHGAYQKARKEKRLRDAWMIKGMIEDMNYSLWLMDCKSEPLTLDYLPFQHNDEYFYFKSMHAGRR